MTERRDGRETKARIEDDDDLIYNNWDGLWEGGLAGSRRLFFSGVASVAMGCEFLMGGGGGA